DRFAVLLRQTCRPGQLVDQIRPRHDRDSPSRPPARFRDRQSIRDLLHDRWLILPDTPATRSTLADSARERTLLVIGLPPRGTPRAAPPLRRALPRHPDGRSGRATR